MRAVRVFYLLLLFGLVLLVTPNNLRAQAPTSLDEYRRVIAESLAFAQQAIALPASERAPLLNRAAETLSAVQNVQTPSGALVKIDNAELIALVRDPQETENAIPRLTALQAAMSPPLAPINPNDLRLLETILNNPPFVRAQNWYDGIIAAILEFLDRIFTNTTQGIFDARDLFVIFAILLVIGIVVYFALNLRRNLVAEEALPPPLTQDDARTPAEAFDNAERLSNAGDYRSAVRQLYLATLLLLDERGRIKYDPTLTNREYLHQAAKDTRTHAALQPIVETFDRTWYGFETISRQDFESYRRRVQEVREL